MEKEKPLELTLQAPDHQYSTPAGAAATAAYAGSLQSGRDRSR
jgi:hypothetical protein